MCGNQFSYNMGSGDEYPPEEKYFLMLLYAPNNKDKLGIAVRGNTWLQKEMFLLSKSMEKLNDLHFDEHIYGPFSPVVESIQLQHINSETIRQPLENGPIRLTEKGIIQAKNLWEKATTLEREIVTKVKQLLNDMDMWELIAYVYSSYPETTKNSDVVDEFNKTRVDAAATLFKRKKVSLERAATIAGKAMEDFLDILKQKNISAFEHSGSNFNEEFGYLERST